MHCYASLIGFLQVQYSQQAHPQQTQYFPGRGPSAGQIPTKAGQGVKYFPSLSGSETDVSTSTENLTQEERYVLRNMERQEPQGEENHHQGPHYGQPPIYQGYPGGPSYHPPPPYNDRLVAQQLVSNNARREALRLETMIAATRQGTPVGTPAPAALHRLNAEEMYGVRMSSSPGGRMAGHQSQPSQSSAVSYHTTTAIVTAPDHNLSRLAPSVYSHPNVQDPILQSPKSFYKDPSVLMPKKGFTQSSSGAYFDTSAISRHQPTDLQAQNDIIAQLTREMKMSGGLSGGSDVESSGSTSTLNNPAATAEKIAALALQAKLNTSMPPNTNNLASGVPKASPTHMGHNMDGIPNKPPPPYQSPHKQTFGGEQKLLASSVNSSPRKASLTHIPGKPESLALLSTTTTTNHPEQEETKALGSPDQPQYTQEMIDIITNENRELKNLVDQNKRKISKLDTLEKEMMKIHEAYQALKEHSEKREILEKSARAKLQGEIAALQQMNKELNERHEYIISQVCRKFRFDTTLTFFNPDDVRGGGEHSGPGLNSERRDYEEGCSCQPAAQPEQGGGHRKMITWSISLARPFFGEVDVPFILSLLDGPGWVVWPGLNIAALGFFVCRQIKRIHSRRLETLFHLFSCQ